MTERARPPTRGPVAVASARPTGGRRLEPDARREQILARALELFGERPYAAVSTAEVAAAAGVTRGLVHHYFGTKRGLYVEVVRHMLLVPRMQLPDDVGETVEARTDACVDWLLDLVSAHGKTFVAVVAAEGIGDDPEVERLLVEADDQAARRMLRLAGVDPELADSPRVRALGRAYATMAKGAIREWVREGTLTRGDVHELLARTLRLVVAQVLGRPAHHPTAPDRGRQLNGIPTAHLDHQPCATDVPMERRHQ